ncbi:uncharacterized protein HMPREF1541_01718 [Cyphellophora europaea CBS 101466]|uniref:BTB domain-containing protein n=1 Tax=Cyphellophora europaea (strain CBS 101466) TaxID=1220924 RepID=W2S1F9_CYPE1|nr:uncharacterized protein HMPREF1541_01718 [Cyphellophora europaea CBS 101466]ETN42561.1 hypothetical protein HMPREF1541_01718 [Cyphellophora europaea CBS 101466]
MPPRSREDFAKFTKNGTVKIIIGAQNPPTQAQIFHIYRDLLITTSPYFREKLTHQRNEQGMFIEDDEDDNDPANPALLPSTLREPDFALAPFKQFIEWIYNKPLTPMVGDHALTADTYLLAHTLRSEPFRNDILDAVRHHHARHPDEQLGLRSMVKLARTMPPDDPNHEGKVKLLEFLVAQLTYKILVRGWHDGGFAGNGLLKRLFASSPVVVMWHLDGLHEMLESQGFTGHVQGMYGRVKEEVDDGATGGEPAKARVKRPNLSLPPNPAEWTGCCFHEHKHRDSKCASAMAID